MLYHLSLERIENDTFIPRIPSIRIEGENSDIPRICFTDSIEHCINSMPMGVMLAKNFIMARNKTKAKPFFYLYYFDETKIPKEFIKYPCEISEYVPDVAYSNEHWCLCPIKCEFKLIELTELETEFIRVPELNRNVIVVTLIKFNEIEKELDKNHIDFYNSFLKLCEKDNTKKKATINNVWGSIAMYDCLKLK